MIKDEDKQNAGANKSVLDQINSLKREDERLYNIFLAEMMKNKPTDTKRPPFLR
jgi:hypothetical protein